MKSWSNRVTRKSHSRLNIYIADAVTNKRIYKWNETQLDIFSVPNLTVDTTNRQGVSGEAALDHVMCQKAIYHNIS